MIETSQDKKILIALATMGCKNVNPDNPSRVAVSITSLYDLLKASEKFIHDFDELNNINPNTSGEV